MKVYLVGGAVRDQLLGYPIKERDWVVVGGTPDQLLKQGYQQVGKQFPVFLHPTTREEYALARTERKSAAGYYGFECQFDPSVRLEDDLARRDLTINAMAMDDAGTLIDPYHGEEDLRIKQLRHVSAAFIEDPVRVLRVARFAARYHHLGFTLAEETRRLMVDMVTQGELSHLVPERVWQEWARSLSERHPEQFIMVLRQCGALRVVIPELERLFGVPNERHEYAIVDSGLRALDALERMAKRSTEPVLRFAALLHNLGHGCISPHHWPIRFPDPRLARQQVDALCRRLCVPNDFRNLARITSECYHTIHRGADLEPEAIVTLFEQCDAFRRPGLFDQLLEVCDALALLPMQQQGEAWRTRRDRCNTLSVQSLIDAGYQGEGIKQALHQQRIDCMTTWNEHENKQ